MARNRFKSGNKSPQFMALRYDLLDHPDYINLSLKAKALLIDVFRQFNGSNNGDFSITLSLMCARGWNSNDSLTKARRELIEAGLLVLTRQGGKNKCSLYGVTFLRIDDCKGKLLELGPTKSPMRKLSK